MAAVSASGGGPKAWRSPWTEHRHGTRLRTRRLAKRLRAGRQIRHEGQKLGKHCPKRRGICRRTGRRSLVTRDGSTPAGRWRLLETIRTYALEKLSESGETNETGRRHAEFFRNLVVPASEAAGLALFQGSRHGSGRSAAHGLKLEGSGFERSVPLWFGPLRVRKRRCQVRSAYALR